MGADGYIACSFVGCPRPDAVSTLLKDKEAEHIVEFKARTFTVRHPLRERLDDALMNCKLHNDIRKMDGPPVPPGRYRAQWYPVGIGSWRWERAEGVIR